MDIEKTLAVVALAFLGLVLGIVALTPLSTGYELSIYNSYPLQLWIVLAASIVCGMILLLGQFLSGKKSRWWLAGLLIVISGNTLFLLMPQFRGYVIYGRGDTLTHLGYIKDILTSGHIGADNFYPVEHILAAILVQVTGLSSEKIAYLFFAFFSALYILNVYILARRIVTALRQVMILTAFALPLTYSFLHVNIHPALLSMVMVPAFLYWHHRIHTYQSGHEKRRHLISLFLLSFFITFFHPITALLVVAILLTFGFTTALYGHIVRRTEHEFSSYRDVGKYCIQTSLILIVSFFSWYFSYAAIQQSFRKVYDWMFNQIGTPLIQTIMEPLFQANLTLSQSVILFMNRHGAILLLFLISSIGSLAVIFRSFSKRRRCPTRIIYAFQFTVAFSIGIIMLLGYFIEYEYNPIRIFRLPILMGTITTGFFTYDFVNRINHEDPIVKKRAVRSVISTLPVLVMLTTMILLSLGNVYGSPRVYDPNLQVTKMEIAGTKWFEIEKTGIPVSGNNPSQIGRFEDYNFGVDSSSLSPALIGSRVPSHFGYDYSNHTAQSLGFKHAYVLVFQLDIVAPLLFPENVRPKVHQYTENDFARLASDPIVTVLYENGEFRVFFVR